MPEVALKLNPLLLGAGIPVAPGLPNALPLDLQSTKVYRNGVLLLQYVVRRG